MRRYRRNEEGGVYPVFLVAFMAVLVMAVALMHVGKAGDMRTRAQTAADAAALGAVAEIRDRALDFLVQGLIPWAGYDPDTTPDAARRYAEANDATVTHIDYRGLLANYAVVEVRGDERLQGIFEAFRGGRAQAEAIATVDFPTCTYPPPDPADENPSPVTGLLCDGVWVPIGASPASFLRLFTIRLVSDAPRKYDIPVVGGPQLPGDPGSADLCAQVGYNAGWRDTPTLIIAVAVALAESGCNPGISSPPNSNDTIDRGLWQINTNHPYSDACVYNAQCNANAAYQIYLNAGSTFLRWCTYEQPACGGNGRGTYKQHIATATAAVNRLQPNKGNAG